MEYRKKPVVIEAFQIGISCCIEEPAWLEDAIGAGIIIPEWLPAGGACCSPLRQQWFSECDINTLEGVMHASKGDYIIKGVKGELYPCKPDIFEATYDPVEDEP